VSSDNDETVTTPAAKRIVAVTGGSRGIGRALCLCFAEPGTHIYFNYHSSDTAAAETQRQVAEAGGQAVGLRTNVAIEKEVAAFFKTVFEKNKRIDVLVNNAGIASDGLLVRMKERQWDDVIDTNLKGAFNCMKIAGRVMLKQRSGRIINMTSVVGVTGNPGQANYAASKAGIIGLTKAAAKELAPRGITVNAVAPGYVETEMTADLSDTVRAAMLDLIPLGRPATPEDVAQVVAFLASEKAAYITGQVIHVNGGMYM
jgi:3-oxoacyl-[acyl-carrier protein] reductase